MSEIVVSVVIPTFARPEYLELALKSVKDQTYSYLEVIVVDDNSDPQHQHQVRRLCADYGATYKRNARTSGACGARNTGVVQARGSYVAFLDDDDVWLPAKIQEQVAFLKENAECPGVYCGHIVRDTFLGCDYYSLPEASRLRQSDLFVGRCPGTTSLVMARREALLRVGLFDELLPSFQDFDMWVRLAASGPIGYVPEHFAVFVHHQGERVSVSVDKRLRGLEIVCTKWQQEISSAGTLKRFKSIYLAEMHRSNGRKLLSVARGRAVQHFTNAVRCEPGNIRNWLWLLLSLGGPRTMRVAVRTHLRRRIVSGVLADR